MTDDQLYDIIGEIVMETGFQRMVSSVSLASDEADSSVNVYGVL